MGETKSVEYSRKAANKTFYALVERCKQLVQNPEPTNFIKEVETLSIFGSYVNSDKEKVHDIDVYVKLRTAKAYLKYTEQEVASFAYERCINSGKYDRYGCFAYDYITDELVAFLKAKSRILSIHTSVDPHILTNREVLEVIKDGTFVYDAEAHKSTRIT